ncbi:Long-chain-fatty-acid--CoA ligase [Pseudovibrio axinellae]|uniref:Long-chain-fatty-acid--CoA ligase n=1 Tax=Pseudovibrio axinellae TaxID=989403 RepID=A0A165U0Q9_9HYPH|nr:class I adenylate-forming enzyme family protein [Pseudovibrio axinellae]KZL09102.1 Long-chain-fatty-acid--CoA ligase [Pseudovibrio axinellae]SER75396.1 Acyl-CoA synthetase (AMP-forming)/AMP-acid ligase II [Pseudovibrio axinellae]
MNKFTPLSEEILSSISVMELKLLHLDPSVGAGNFAEKALAVSLNPDQPCLLQTEAESLAKGVQVEQLSLAELVDLSHRWASWYWKKGIRAHDVVAVYANDGLTQIVHFCALTLIGAVAAVTNGAMPGDVASAHFRHLRVRGIVTSAKQKAALDPALRNEVGFCIEIAKTAIPRKPEEFTRHRHDATDPVMITHSSGTTGRPKPVTLAHGQWFHGIRDNLARQGERTGERRLLSLPASHNSSIAFIIHAVLDGSQVLVAHTQSGDFAAEAIERFQPSTVAAFPITYVTLALRYAGSADFSSVRYWVNSGDAAHEKHIRRLVAHGTTPHDGGLVVGSTFVDGLGSSEMGHISFPVQHTKESSIYGRCIGRPHHWVDAQVFLEDGHRAKTNEVGRLGIKSPSITPGYWNDSDLTARSRIDGYFLTGDLVYRDEGGRFFHVDRTSDVIRTGEGPCYSLLSEELLMKLDEIVDDCILSSIDGKDGMSLPVAVVWSERAATMLADPLLETFNETLKDQNMPQLYAVAVVESAAIPRGITGKVLKRTLKENIAEAIKDQASASWLLDFEKIDND